MSELQKQLDGMPETLIEHLIAFCIYISPAVVMIFMCSSLYIIAVVFHTPPEIVHVPCG